MQSQLPATITLLHFGASIGSHVKCKHGIASPGDASVSLGAAGATRCGTQSAWYLALSVVFSVSQSAAGLAGLEGVLLAAIGPTTPDSVNSTASGRTNLDRNVVISGSL